MGGWQVSCMSGKGTHLWDTTWCNPGFAQTDEHPVCLVTWDDSIAFCKWLNKQEHAEYRLPTEAEWEYACPTDSGAIRPTDTASLEQFAWNLPNADMHTWPVGRKRPNAWNLYDMCGNVPPKRWLG